MEENDTPPKPLTAKEAAFAILVISAPILGALLMGNKMQKLGLGEPKGRRR